MLSGAVGERELTVRPAANPLRSASLQETEPGESAGGASAAPRTRSLAECVNGALAWGLIRTTVRDSEKI